MVRALDRPLGPTSRNHNISIQGNTNISPQEQARLLFVIQHILNFSEVPLLRMGGTPRAPCLCDPTGPTHPGLNNQK
jgi:hypothetical protein